MQDELSLIHSISHRLDSFKTVVANQSYQFRCNICGDSQKSKFKARGYFIFSNEHQKYFFKCHNCGVSLSLENYAKEYFPEEYSDFKVKTFIEKSDKPKDFSLSDNVKEKLKNVPKELLLKMDTHLYPIEASKKCLNYVKSRMIPKEQYHRLKYTDNFNALVKQFDINKKYENRNLPEDERLVILIKDAEGNIKGIQGRSLPDNPTKLRYATTMFSDDNKIFGLEQVDWTKDVMVTEGAIDSLFLTNSIAFNGGSSSVINHLSPEQKEKLIIVLDNEPRHKDTIKRFKTEIENGYRVIDWSNLNTDKKDINDMVLSGITPQTIQEYILKNNLSGAKANLNLIKWKKL